MTLGQVLFLLRHIMEEEWTFQGAVKTLGSENLIAPVYFTLAGPNKGEGATITRDRNGEQPRVLLASSPDGFIVQTNIDHWQNSVDPVWANEDDLLLNSVDRRKAASKSISHLLQKGKLATIEDCFIPLAQEPVCNLQTNYCVVMSLARGFCSTRVILDPVGYSKQFCEK